MSIPQGDYAQMLNGYFGFLSQEKRNALWTEFASNQGISPLTPPSNDTTKAQFLSFLQTNFNQDIIQDVLSPDERKKRQLIFSVYDIIVTLMKTIQDTSTVSEDAVAFLTRYQKMYTDMASRVPLYKGAASSTFHADFTDPDKFTFGYGDISVTDIANYLLAPAKYDTSNNVTNNSFTISTPTVELTKPTTGTVGKIGWSVVFTKAPNNNGWGTIQLNQTLGEGFNSPGTATVQTVSVYIDPNASSKDQQAAWTNGILSFLSNYIRSTPVQVKVVNPSTVLQTSNSIFSIFGWQPPDVAYALLSRALSDTDANYLLDNNVKVENGLIYVVWPRPASTESLSDGLNAVLAASPIQMVTPPPEKQFNVNWRFGNSTPDGNPTRTWSQNTFTSFGIPWRYTTENVPGQAAGVGSWDDQENFTRTSAIVQSRAQTNQRNQQFISQIQSKRQSLKDRASEVQNTVQASMSSLRGQSGILRSTIQALQTILNRIYQ